MSGVSIFFTGYRRLPLYVPGSAQIPAAHNRQHADQRTFVAKRADRIDQGGFQDTNRRRVSTDQTSPVDTSKEGRTTPRPVARSRLTMNYCEEQTSCQAPVPEEIKGPFRFCPLVDSCCPF